MMKPPLQTSSTGHLDLQQIFPLDDPFAKFENPSPEQQQQQSNSKLV